MLVLLVNVVLRFLNHTVSARITRCADECALNDSSCFDYVRVTLCKSDQGNCSDINIRRKYGEVNISRPRVKKRS
jgi:hypothetical protein